MTGITHKSGNAVLTIKPLSSLWREGKNKYVLQCLYRNTFGIGSTCPSFNTREYQEQ